MAGCMIRADCLSGVLLTVTDFSPPLAKILPLTFHAMSPGHSSSSLARGLPRQCLRMASRDFMYASMKEQGLYSVAKNQDNVVGRVKHLGVHSSGLVDLCA